MSVVKYVLPGSYKLSLPELEEMRLAKRYEVTDPFPRLYTNRFLSNVREHGLQALTPIRNLYVIVDGASVREEDATGSEHTDRYYQISRILLDDPADPATFRIVPHTLIGKYKSYPLFTMNIATRLLEEGILASMSMGVDGRINFDEILSARYIEMMDHNMDEGLSTLILRVAITHEETVAKLRQTQDALAKQEKLSGIKSREHERMALKAVAEDDDDAPTGLLSAPLSNGLLSAPLSTGLLSAPAPPVPTQRLLTNGPASAPAPIQAKRSVANAALGVVKGNFKRVKNVLSGASCTNGSQVIQPSTFSSRGRDYGAEAASRTSSEAGAAGVFPAPAGGV